MIICSREESTSISCLSEKFHQIMKQIFTYNINHLQLGEYAIIEDKLILKIMDKALTHPDEKEFEIHYDYYDVHIPIDGTETLGFATTSTHYELITPFDKNKDMDLSLF